MRKFVVLAVATVIASCASKAAAPSSSEPSLPKWIVRPHDLNWNAYYPERAAADNVAGAVTLDCLINIDTTLDCTVAAEEPKGYGFGAAAIDMSRKWRVMPRMRQSIAIEGVRLSVPLSFKRFAPSATDKSSRSATTSATGAN
ncbi:MAG: energy transducer TonB [Alphaproteobacteria bacterium]|nr:energy transducer TonB [Alphaproteobacteria bacterium]